MSEVSFFTPIEYRIPEKSFVKSLIEKVDDYFWLYGKKAYVIKTTSKTGQAKAVLSTGHESLLKRMAICATYFFVIIPAALLLLKAACRLFVNIRLISAQHKIEKGMEIPQSALTKLQKLMPLIRLVKKDPELIWLKHANTLVFKLTELPNVVFKLTPDHIKHNENDPNRLIKERYANMIKAKEVCIAERLSLLVLPHAKKLSLTVEGIECQLIAEEALDFNSDESSQDAMYQNNLQELVETVRQLAHFIAFTGFGDVDWRNIPLLPKGANQTEAKPKGRRVGLIDVEDLSSAVIGFIGAPGNGSNRGLIKCLGSEELINLSIREARKQGVGISSAKVIQAKKVRLEELESDKRLKHFHERNGIKTGEEPLRISIEALELDLKESVIAFLPLSSNRRCKSQDRKVSLGEVAQLVIKTINENISNRSKNSSVKGKRHMLLNDSEGALHGYMNLATSHGKWLDRILQALVDKGVLFKFAHNPYGIEIQV